MSTTTTDVATELDALGWELQRSGLSGSAVYVAHRRAGTANETQSTLDPDKLLEAVKQREEQLIALESTTPEPEHADHPSVGLGSEGA